MSQYLLAVNHQPGVHAAGSAYQDEAAMQEAFQKVGAFNQSLEQSGRLVYACGLEAPETTKIVAKGEEAKDGPLKDSGWQLGGFWVVEADDDAAALELGTQATEACGQTIEIRRMQG